MEELELQKNGFWICFPITSTKGYKLW